MSDYDYICQILNNDFKKNQDLLSEERDARGHKPQRVKVISNHGISHYSIYEFGDRDNSDLFPFFNKNHSDSNLPKTPQGLFEFCDFVMLVEFKRKLFILLIELKRSKNIRHAREQLDAAKTFMDFVLSSAARIKALNSQIQFDKQNVSFRRIILKQVSKEPGNSHFPVDINLNDYITYQTVSNFYIREVI